MTEYDSIKRFYSFGKFNNVIICSLNDTNKEIVLRGHKDIAKSVCVSFACHLFLIESKGGEDNFIVWDLQKSLKLVF